MILFNIHVVHDGMTSIYQGQVRAADKQKAIAAGRRMFGIAEAAVVKATPALG